MPELTELREQDINNTITTVRQRAPMWDVTTERVNDAANCIDMLKDRITVLEIELSVLQSQVSELLRRSGMKCESLL